MKTEDPVWSLQRGADGRLDCVVVRYRAGVYFGEIHRNNEFFRHSVSFPQRGDALRWAAQERQALERDGWTLPPA